jgi:hypothetical protein
MPPRLRRSIEQDTSILTYAVADTVCLEVIANEDLRNRAVAFLTPSADEVYRANEDFAKKIRASGNRGRDHLYMFMRHWLASWLKENAPVVFRSLPPDYAIGRPPPRGFVPVEVSLSTKKRKSVRSTKALAAPPPPPSAALVLRVPANERLPDNAAFTNRFYVKSGSSNLLWTIAQSKTGRWWGCNCPGWITHRTCRHLKALQLPAHQQPYEALLK